MSAIYVKSTFHIVWTFVIFCHTNILVVSRSVRMCAYHRRTKVNGPLRNGIIFRAIKKTREKIVIRHIVTLSHKINMLTNGPYLSKIC